MSFPDTYSKVLKQYQVEEKLDWKSLLAAGLIAAPGAAKEIPQKDQPAIVQKSVKPSSEEEFFYRIKHEIKNNEGSSNFNTIKKLHRAPKDPTIGWGHSLKRRNASKAIFNNVLPEFKFEEIFNTNNPAALTEPQAEKLLNYDVNKRIIELKNIFPKVFKYDYNTQQALFDLLYRGDIRDGVGKLLNTGEKAKAIDLIRSRIQNAEPGVKIRVERNLKALEASPFLNKPKPAPQKPVAKPPESR